MLLPFTFPFDFPLLSDRPRPIHSSSSVSSATLYEGYSFCFRVLRFAFFILRSRCCGAPDVVLFKR
ncbi:hypothetical protein M407DRAFT_205758 [Tulasnella calospora MUT 4182]|uniref:Uncharacterized protein n=1 Tax=Tulasnella calospora MUT 4182 TaxID=1051891 RepID=A0A0C3QIU4_9AGAM|nr:hypothetical protein M407DRAFT_205758 [Tulasnella calospora MUT 4182]